MRDAGILDYVRFVKVPLSLTDLMSRAVKLQRGLEAQAVEVGVTVDTATGGVTLHPKRNFAESERFRAAGAAADSGLPFTWGDPPPTPAFIGGGLLRNTTSGEDCTGGFTAGTGTGNRVMTTAAHCGSVGHNVVYNGNAGFEFTARRFDSFHDVARIDKSGANFTAQVDFGSANRTVLARELWSSMNVGDQVAKYGRTTGFTVGTITDRHACSPASCDPEAIFVAVRALNDVDMCLLGDSGGPVMYGSTAFGLVSGTVSGTSPKVCVYMPQQLTNAVGVTVTIAIP